MVDLKAKPYYLSEEDIAWVQKTIAGMTAEEKVGQLFFDNQGQATDEQLQEMIAKYHLGGFRYNGIPCKRVQEVVRVLQTTSPIPLFIACNTESGGNGTGTDGTYIADGIKIGATGNEQYAYDMAYMGNEEGAVTGNNMAFAPVCDIHYNWENTEIVKRAFGNDVDRVRKMSVAYMQGVHALPHYASVAKHFPGNGQDFRDAHLSSNINEFTKDEWMATYGSVYKALIDGGLDGVMAGHIMLPKYMREVRPGITDDEMMPATLCPELIDGLLRKELGFNGVVITDATHMVGMTNRMSHADMVPATINAGCDMFLFFNDPDEDFGIMLNAYKTGVISEERMQEALMRILGLKVHMGLTKIPKEDLVPPPQALSNIGKQEYKDKAAQIAKDALTLVKYKDADVLPLTPEKYKKIMIVYVKGNDGAMAQLMKFAFGGNGPKKNPAEVLRDLLIARGFDAFVYESPIDKAKRLAAEGKSASMDAYHMGKSSIAEFKAAQDLVITVFDVANGRPAFGMTKGGGEIPWYVHDVPTIGISVNSPTMLADAPTLRTYINAYDSRPCTMDALVDALLSGPQAFRGKDPIDSFCGLWDTHI